jgi:hypothetical protein
MAVHMAVIADEILRGEHVIAKIQLIHGLRVFQEMGLETVNVSAATIIYHAMKEVGLLTASTKTITAICATSISNARFQNAGFGDK